MKPKNIMIKIILFVFIISVLQIPNNTSTGSTKKLDAYTIENAFPNLSFNSPMDLQDPRDGSGKVFVVEQGGIIKIFDRNASATQSTVFLDISSKVICCGEQGLLGMVFHPDYYSNGYFFVDYTAPSPLRTVVARYQVEESNPNIANVSSELIIIEIDQPYTNHNAGQVLFDNNGYLLIPLGDGGSGGDPNGHGQNKSTLLGSLLRIDIDNHANGENYGIPTDNPYIGNVNNYKEEIYAYGLRNPWRMSKDRDTGKLWLGDVGQGLYEEVDIIEKGKNYGWNTMEAFACYSPSTGCDQTGLELPIHSYSHGADGIAIVGGYVYRGSELPSLLGKYIYGDYSSGRIWALEYDGINPTNNSLLIDNTFQMSSFGEDAKGEHYILSLNGSIFKFKSEIAQTQEAPIIFPISNISIRESQLAVMAWQATDDTDGIYMIYQDGEKVKEDQWEKNALIGYSTESLNVGKHNITLKIVDIDGLIAVSTVWVIVEPMIGPEVISPGNLTVIEGEQEKLEWKIIDNNSGKYKLYRNDILVQMEYWEGNTSIEYEIDKLPQGEYNMTLDARKDSGMTGDMVMLTILKNQNKPVTTKPVILPLGKIAIKLNTTLDLQWIAFDADPAGYTIFENTIEVQEGTWENGSIIELEYSPESPGMKNITIEVRDQEGNLETSTNWVEVLGVKKPTIIKPENKTLMGLGIQSTVYSFFVDDDNPDNYFIYRNSTLEESGNVKKDKIIGYFFSAVQSGIYNITIVVNDKDNLMDTVTFWITVQVIEDPTTKGPDPTTRTMNGIGLITLFIGLSGIGLLRKKLKKRK